MICKFLDASFLPNIPKSVIGSSGPAISQSREHFTGFISARGMLNTSLTNWETLAFNVDSKSLVAYESLVDYGEGRKYFFQNNMKIAFRQRNTESVYCLQGNPTFHDSLESGHIALEEKGFSLLTHQEGGPSSWASTATGRTEKIWVSLWSGIRRGNKICKRVLNCHHPLTIATALENADC